MRVPVAAEMLEIALLTQRENSRGGRERRSRGFLSGSTRLPSKRGRGGWRGATATGGGGCREERSAQKYPRGVEKSEECRRRRLH